MPWASFCMSTYKRPDFLSKQLSVLLQQGFTNFEVIVSDNDIDQSGEKICNEFNDPRIKYYCNNENLGMVKSFNKSIDRASGEFVVMVTDDDPVDSDMLRFFKELENEFKGYGLYCGGSRKNKQINEVEVIPTENAIIEILHPEKTIGIHWSSCILNRALLQKIGKLVDFGSGHLVDHILLCNIAKENGFVIINKEFSSIQLHDNNYSKLNITNYLISCKGFYSTMMQIIKGTSNYYENEKVILLHLHCWFIGCFFNLRKYFTLNKNSSKILELDSVAKKILELPYMKRLQFKYYTKRNIFRVKKILKQL